MKKRELKKRVNRSISAAIDYVLLTADSKNVEAKTEKLLAIYEEMIKDINNSKLLKKEKSMKAHFNNLKTDFNKKINKVFESL